MEFNSCIVIPSYNHALSVEKLVPFLATFNLPVIIVNDASHQEDAALLHRLAEINEWIELLEHAQNQGKGGAVKTGLKTAHERGFSHAIQIDADGQHDLADLPIFVSTAKENPTAIVTGRPVYDESVPTGRLYGRYLTHIWIWVETLSFDIKDSMCGYRVYPLGITHKILSTTTLGKRMDFDPEILVRLHWLGVPVISISTKVIYPADGVSHFRMWEDNWLITKMHTRLVFGMLWRLPRLIWRKFQ